MAPSKGVEYYLFINDQIPDKFYKNCFLAKFQAQAVLIFNCRNIIYGKFKETISQSLKLEIKALFNMLNMFKVKNKDTRVTSVCGGLVFLLVQPLSH